MTKAWVANVHFLVNDWIPLWFNEDKIELLRDSLIPSSVLLRQLHHEIPNQIIRAIFFRVINIAYKSFLYIDGHKILSLNFDV